MHATIFLLIDALLFFVLIFTAIFVNIIVDRNVKIQLTESSVVIGYKLLITCIAGPIILLCSGFLIHYFNRLVLPYFLPPEIMIRIHSIEEILFYPVLFVSISWFLFRIFSTTKYLLIRWSNLRNIPYIKIFAPVVIRGLKIIVAIAVLNLILPFFKLSPYYFHIAEKILNIFLIMAVTWIILQTITAVEKLMVFRYENRVSDSFKARGIYTQIHILKKITFLIVALVSIALMLMVFDGVKELGTSILASAGLATAIVGFAGQKSLGSILAGFQLMMTQPIRIKDQVIVEGEFGEIEEITLTYVVIKLWDLRRLIVPVSYFMEKPFQNWTRTSKDLLVTVFFHFDYSLPIEPLRNEMRNVLNKSLFWNKKLATLQITDAKETSIEVRILASADDTDSAWNLRCELREKLISFIQEKYSFSLPKTRAVISPQKDTVSS